MQSISSTLGFGTVQAKEFDAKQSPSPAKLQQTDFDSDQYEGGSQENQSSGTAQSREEPNLVLQFSDKDVNITQSGIEKLNDKIEKCHNAIQYAKLLIQNYKDVFEKELRDLQADEYANELIQRNYEQGLSVLSAYLSIILMIENYLKDIDTEKLAKDVMAIEADTQQIKSRYYMLESRLNTIVEMLTTKMNQLMQEKD